MDATESTPESEPKLAPAYACRQCGRPLSHRDGEVACPDGHATIRVVDGIPHFPVPDDGTGHETLFDQLAPIYETPLWFTPLYRFVGGPAAPRDDRSTVAAMLELEPEDAVLDIACGTGRIARGVAPEAASVVGIDISAGMLERAQRYATRRDIDDVAFAQMNAEQLWFDADVFDRVTCCWALHLLPDVDRVLEEIRRVLRPGGWLVGTVLVDEYVLEWPPVRGAARGVLDADPFAVDAFRDRLRDAGFSDLEFDRRGATLFFRARGSDQ